MTSDPTNVGNLLMQARAATPEAIEAAVERQKRTNSRLGTELLGAFDVTPVALKDALLKQYELRGEPPDMVAIARTIASSASLHHYRLSEMIAEVRAVLGG